MVYDFIHHVGMEWMDHVQAVACDMNSDFQEAFEERCPNIKIVFDHFHIVKNFNDKVITEVRKDVQRELAEKGEKGVILRAENTLFGLKPVIAKTGYVKRYKDLLKQNSLFLACDLVKEALDQTYQCTTAKEMADQRPRSLIRAGERKTSTSNGLRD